MKKIKEMFLKYKNKKCKTWIGALIQLFVCNNLARLILFLIMAIFASAMSSAFESDSIVWFLMFWIGFGYSAVFGIIMIIFAWIINPIKYRKKK
ncbi:MAG: hypothetical protein WC466_02910 [Candidatus Izemoplasmatales bacterium]